MINGRGQLQSYFFGAAAAGTGVTFSDYSLGEWLQLIPLGSVPDWDLTGWGAAVGIVLGIIGVSFRLISDIATEVRNRRKYRLEIEILNLQLREQRGKKNGAFDDSGGSGGSS